MQSDRILERKASSWRSDLDYAREQLRIFIETGHVDALKAAEQATCRVHHSMRRRRQRTETTITARAAR